MKAEGIKIRRGTVQILNNNWLHSILYLNKTTNEAWAIGYSSSNSWTDYHDKNIIQMFGNNPIYREKFTKTKILERIAEIGY